ncbi:MAG: serine hydrolase [Candidatus Latescibacteria bacterium]|nr:serine hydrolase [Candidatus Latescibacterota bacterium]
MPLFKAIEQRLQEAVDQGIAPGLALAFGQANKPLFSRFYGHATLLPRPQPLTQATLFDLASLTKILGTTLIAMHLHRQGRLDLDRPLGAYRPSAYSDDLAATTPRLLLAHASGLPSSMSLYRDRPADPADPSDQRQEAFARARQANLVAPTGTVSRYSDLGPILLGDLFETLLEGRLDRLCQDLLYGPLGVDSTFFVALDDPLPQAQRPSSAFAATEQCSWRQRLIRGQVHDENAYFLRGVAGHAGLFSDLDDLVSLACFLLAAHAGDKDFLPAPTLAEFTRRQNLVPDSSRALGWDTPFVGASCGGRFSPQAFGHTGFTGTSIWLDPVGQRFVVLLANRVHPHRDNRAFLRFRPQLHDMIIEALDRL